MHMPKNPPPIAIALGGGIARGWAHIGVLRALEAAGHAPEIYAGTSIGAVVAGAQAAGKLDALELWARGLNRRRVLSLLDVAFGGAGLFAGERLAEILKREMGDILIENLRTPIAIVATELKSGQEVWLRAGSLTRAIRASYALPGVFAPQAWEGTWLVDGALVNPCPVSAARALGGRVVIGVSLHGDLPAADRPDTDQLELPLPGQGGTGGAFSVLGKWLRPDRLLLERIFQGSGGPSLSVVMTGALNILLDRVTRARLAGDPPEVLIAPKVGHIGLVDFHRAAELIDAGARAAQAALPALEDAIRRLR
jgi:NTE family protein